MHNGQVGGYDNFRRDADMMIPDHLYPHRKGATDSEALFLAALAEGLDGDPRGALERASARFIRLSREKGTLPHLRMTAALSDGRRLYAVRYATDDAAPSLYYRWSASRNGIAVVSEPLEADEGGWTEVPAASFCTFEGEDGQSRRLPPLPSGGCGLDLLHRAGRHAQQCIQPATADQPGQQRHDPDQFGIVPEPGALIKEEPGQKGRAHNDAQDPVNTADICFQHDDFLSEFARVLCGPQR